MLLKRIEKYIADNYLLARGARVVVGLSGGADSVCLTHVLRELGYGVVAVHCNFHLRGEESDRDERFVLHLCEEWGVECVKVDFDTEAYALGHGLSIEMAARELRYDFFRKVMRERGCDAIAVGHHQDDNIETMLLNLARGTGLRGLCAIQPRNGDVVRPLLCVSRAEIEKYLEKVERGKLNVESCECEVESSATRMERANVPNSTVDSQLSILFVTDHTNLEDSYARNKVRLNILPELERINAGARGNILTTIENLAEVRKVYEAAVNQSIAQCCTCAQDGSTMRIDVARLMDAPSPVSVLHELLSPLGFNRSQLSGILDSVKTGAVFHSDRATLLINRDCMVVAEKGWDLPRQGSLSDFGISARLVGAEEIASFGGDAAYLDAGKVRHELTVRTPRAGDTFAPFGMGGKRKLVSDFLTDQKVSLIDKAQQLLVCDGDEIVWVVGRRASELYRVTGATQQVMVLDRGVRQ